LLSYCSSKFCHCKCKQTDEEQSNGSFDNDEYNSSEGEIGGGIDEELSDNEDGNELVGEVDLSSTDNSEQEESDAEQININ
jgi:hypothetical protein